MEKSLIDKPNFDRINKFNVSIISLKNQLRNADNMDMLTHIADKIIELEQQIMLEKSVGYKKLEKEKKEIAHKIDRIKRTLKLAEDDMARIGNSIKYKTVGYKNTLQKKIDILSSDYEVAMQQYNRMND